eukprot:8102940-Heterocapsa_arctica.AAC.1
MDMMRGKIDKELKRTKQTEQITKKLKPEQDCWKDGSGKDLPASTIIEEPDSLCRYPSERRAGR